MRTGNEVALPPLPNLSSASGKREEIALRVTGLTKRYGTRTAVASLDFEVRRGEVFGFLGPNGAGKTTTLAMILGLIKPTSGRVEIMGHDVTAGNRTGLKQVGAIIESPAYYPYLSALDNLHMLAKIRGDIPPPRYAEVLALAGLQGRERDRFGTYSLGMKQRLGIAGALLPKPALLILDEPGNGLDPAGMVEMRTLILRLAREGQTILLCSHLLAEVQQVCDRVLILANGQCVAQGEVATLLRQEAQTLLRVEAPEQTATLLSQVSWIRNVSRAEGMEDTLVLTMEAGYEPTLGRFLAGQGIVVLEMRRQERDLEQLFLTLTGNTGRSHTP